MQFLHFIKREPRNPENFFKGISSSHQHTSCNFLHSLFLSLIPHNFHYSTHNCNSLLTFLEKSKSKLENMEPSHLSRLSLLSLSYHDFKLNTIKKECKKPWRNCKVVQPRLFHEKSSSTYSSNRQGFKAFITPPEAPPLTDRTALPVRSGSRWRGPIRHSPMSLIRLSVVG